MELLPILSDVSGSRKSQMVACKPEVLLSQLVDKIETRFLRLTPHFRKCGYSRQNFVAILYRSWDIMFFHIYFRLRMPSVTYVVPLTSNNVVTGPILFPDPENVDVAVGISSFNLFQVDFKSLASHILVKLVRFVYTTGAALREILRPRDIRWT